MFITLDKNIYLTLYCKKKARNFIFENLGYSELISQKEEKIDFYHSLYYLM